MANWTPEELAQAYDSHKAGGSLNGQWSADELAQAYQMHTAPVNDGVSSVVGDFPKPFDYTSPSDVAGAAWSGIKAAPANLYHLGAGAFGAAQDAGRAIAHPIDTYNNTTLADVLARAKTMGDIGAAGGGFTEGAAAGGALGLMGGPLAPITVPVGALTMGALGAASGSSVWHKLLQTLGQEDPTTNAQDAEGLVSNTAGGIAMSAPFAAVGGLAAKASDIEAARGAALEKRGLGTTVKTLKDALTSKNIYADDDGFPSSANAEDATIKTAFDKNIERAKAMGIVTGENLNDPAKLMQAIDAQRETQAEIANDIFEKAHKATQDKLQNTLLNPTEVAAKRARLRATGGSVFDAEKNLRNRDALRMLQPDYTGADAYIEDTTPYDAEGTLSKKLTTTQGQIAEDITEDGLKGLLKAKQKSADAGDFSARNTNPAEGVPQSQLHKNLYSATKNKIVQVIADNLSPEDAKNYDEANQNYSALENLRKAAVNAAAKKGLLSGAGNFLKGASLPEALALGAHALGSPVTAAAAGMWGLFRGIGEARPGLGRGTANALSSLYKIPRDAGRSGAMLAALAPELYGNQNGGDNGDNLSYGPSSGNVDAPANGFSAAPQIEAQGSFQNPSLGPLAQTLLKATMGAEGAHGDINAVSPKGAKGLMQVMPNTLTYALNKMGEKLDPKDDTQRTRAGMYYLGEQLKKYGSLPHALAAYNAGPGHVHAGEDWRAHLPIPHETVPYVNRIANTPYKGGS